MVGKRHPCHPLSLGNGLVRLGVHLAVLPELHDVLIVLRAVLGHLDGGMLVRLQLLGGQVGYHRRPVTVTQHVDGRPDTVPESHTTTNKSHL